MPPKKIKSPLRKTKIRNSNSLRQNIIINYPQNKRARQRQNRAPLRKGGGQIVRHVHVYQGQSSPIYPTFQNNIQPAVNEAEKIKIERQEMNTPAPSKNPMLAKNYVDPTEPKAFENKKDKFVDAVEDETPSLPPIGSMTVAQIELRLKRFGYTKKPEDRKQSLYEKLARFM